MNDSMDLNPLIRLKEALEGAQKNTSKMLTKLEKFESRLTDLDDKMRPIQTTTKHYTKAKENIGLTLIEVGKTYEYFRVADEVKETISVGLSISNQKEFYLALERLSNAKAFFDNHKEIKSSISVLSSIELLLNQAVTACLGEFEKILSTSGKSIEFVDGKYTLLNPLSMSCSKDIKAICEAFETNKLTAHFRVYQNVRAGKVRAELREAEALHAKDWSLSAALDRGPYEHGTHPFRHFFAFGYNLLRSELQLWGNTLPSNEESLQVFVAICEVVIQELSKAVSPLLIVTLDKSTSQNQVIRQSTLFLIRLDILNVFIDRYEEFRDLCRPDVRHESAASLSLLKMRDSVLQSVTFCVEYLLSRSLAEGFSVGKKSTNDSESATCDLHPVCGNLVHCCKEMVVFDSTYKHALDLSAEASLSVASSVPHECEDFVISLLENLYGALDTRAENFDAHQSRGKGGSRRSMSVKTHSLFEAEDRAAEEFLLGARKHLFLANNLFFLLSFAREKRAELQNVQDRGASGAAAKQQQKRGVGGSAQSKLNRVSTFVDTVNTRLTKEQSLFCDRVACTLGVSVEDMSEFSTAYQRDKSGQSRLLKAKFSLFNTGMDALLAQQGEWRISAAGLREQLGAQVLSKVIPVYGEFYAAYSSVKFSKKHMEQYLRFPPVLVERDLRSFFGKS